MINTCVKSQQNKNMICTHPNCQQTSPECQLCQNNLHSGIIDEHQQFIKLYDDVQNEAKTYFRRIIDQQKSVFDLFTIQKQKIEEYSVQLINFLNVYIKQQKGRIYSNVEQLHTQYKEINAILSQQTDQQLSKYYKMRANQENSSYIKQICTTIHQFQEVLSKTINEISKFIPESEAQNNQNHPITALLNQLNVQQNEWDKKIQSLIDDHKNSIKIKIQQIQKNLSQISIQQSTKQSILENSNNLKKIQELNSEFQMNLFEVTKNKDELARMLIEALQEKLKLKVSLDNQLQSDEEKACEINFQRQQQQKLEIEVQTPKFNSEQNRLFMQNFKGKIHQNLSLQILEQHGFIKIYDESFSKQITEQQINTITQQCTEASLICVGARERHNDQYLQLSAIDNTIQAFKMTEFEHKAQKSPNGELYWYFLKNYSFGFSPIQKISLLQDLFKGGDIDHQLGEYRLSISFHKDGGFRVGKQTNLWGDSDFNKVLYLLR